jgi:hypothetical protein
MFATDALVDAANALSLIGKILTAFNAVAKLLAVDGL